MRYWRLLTHKDKDFQSVAAEKLVEKSIIATGWGEVGDLDEMNPSDAPQIAAKIKDLHPEWKNSHSGGSSLWSFWKEMAIGDLVIIRGRNKNRKVVRIVGEYRFSPTCPLGYDHNHLRAIVPLSVDPDELWRRCGGLPQSAQMFLTVVPLNRPFNDRQNESILTRDRIRVGYVEGEVKEATRRFRTRNRKLIADKRATLPPDAPCEVCNFTYKASFGGVVSANLDLHHMNPIEERNGVTVTHLDELVLVCPNCHRAIHSFDPPLPPAELSRLLVRNEL